MLLPPLLHRVATLLECEKASAAAAEEHRRTNVVSILMVPVFICELCSCGNNIIMLCWSLLTSPFSD